ncbi:MAG: cobyric acid synthase, partial [Aeromicrobium sp.]
EGDGFRRAWLREVAGPDFVVGTVGFGELRERRMDLLADLIEMNLDVDALLGLIADGAPADLAILPPGDSR